MDIRTTKFLEKLRSSKNLSCSFFAEQVKDIMQTNILKIWWQHQVQ